MTRFGRVMATYFAALAIAAIGLRPSGAQTDLERQRQRTDRALCRAPDGALHDAELVVVMPPEPVASFLGAARLSAAAAFRC